jgi:hypothetical protein
MNKVGAIGKISYIHTVSEKTPSISTVPLQDVFLRERVFDVKCDISDRVPCMDEFKDLMKCIQNQKSTSCHVLFLNLKSCLRAHGLNI